MNDDGVVDGKDIVLFVEKLLGARRRQLCDSVQNAIGASLKTAGIVAMVKTAMGGRHNPCRLP
ncbi:MAG TPA: hypothetical protein VMT24_19955 [Aggregatilineaceae bacterium]|nr:hypothetical protein [Aggregatilineaceae bacterium]